MKILIAGLAKTGTTGLLYLISNSFEKRPRLLFEPKKSPPGLERAKGHAVAKVLITPRLDAASFSHFDRKVTLLRDPRDRLISALLYSQYHARYLADDALVDGVRRCLEKKESSPGSVSIREILEAIARAAGKPDLPIRFRQRTAIALSWFDQYVAAIPDGLLYRYEHFVSGDYSSLEKHLRIPLGGDAKVPDKFHRVERTKGYGDWRHWFTAEDVRDYRPAFAPWLEKYGYDPEDWALDPAPAISPKHCSAYFTRLVEEYRGRRSASPQPEPAQRSRSRAGGLKGTGRILRAEPGIVAGWAIGPDPARPVRVALHVNGREVAQTVANKLRAALKQRGIHPTGRCGFAFEIKPGEALRVGDRVTVSPVSADFAIKNSPRVVSAPGGSAP